MPIYEYQCKQCGHRADKLQKMDDAPFTQCPACQQDGFERLVSAAGFQLKGSGWYVTDFRDKASPATDTAKSAATTTTNDTSGE
jgi:putative FmdB family regulatory protein